VPVDWLREFVLIDTPGIGEPEDVAAELVYEELPRADVIVFVLHAQAALKRSERRFLSERLLRQDRAKVVFLLNQIDHLQPEQVTELEGYVQRQLETLVPHPTLLTYSALEALRGRLTGDAALLERANYPAVARVLVDELREDRERLRQVNALLQLRQGLETARTGLQAREEALRLSLAEIDQRLARLEGEEARFCARLDRVAAHAAGHLDLITRHLEAELQALRLRVDRELPKLVEGADPVQLRKQLPFYLEHLVKSYLEWQLPALEARLAELYAEIDDELSAAVAEALRGLDLQPGYLAAALRTRPAHYDKATQASRFLGVTGMIALLLVRLPLAAGMLAASQALRYLARGRREAAERAQMVEAGRRAMRAGLERASEDLGRQLEEYKTRVVTALRAEGAARMASVTSSLQDARSARAAAEEQRAGPAHEWTALGAELDALLARVAAYEQALAGDKPAHEEPV
jgi:hypothetical protein